MDELFRGADYLTLHVGLTPQTTGYQCPNVGHDEEECAHRQLRPRRADRDEALVAALRSGQVAG